MDQTDFTVDRTKMVRLLDIFCSNSEGNSLWVDRQSVGQRSVGRRTRARSVEANYLACLALWSSERVFICGAQSVSCFMCL